MPCCGASQLETGQEKSVLELVKWKAFVLQMHGTFLFYSLCNFSPASILEGQWSSLKFDSLHSILAQECFHLLHQLHRYSKKREEHFIPQQLYPHSRTVSDFMWFLSVIYVQLCVLAWFSNCCYKWLGRDFSDEPYWTKIQYRSLRGGGWVGFRLRSEVSIGHYVSNVL